MAPIHGVGHTKNGTYLGRQKIILLIQRRSYGKFLKGNKFFRIKANGTGDNLSLPVRQSDDLRGHNNLIGAFGRAVHADVFSAVMKQYRNLQKKPFPFSHAMDSLHLIKNSQGQIFRSRQMRLVALVTLGNVLGRLYNIVFKIVAGLKDLFPLRIIVGQAVA